MIINISKNSNTPEIIKIVLSLGVSINTNPLSVSIISNRTVFLNIVIHWWFYK